MLLGVTHDLGDLCSSPSQEALGVSPETSLELGCTAVVTPGQVTVVDVQDFVRSRQFCHHHSPPPLGRKQGRRASGQGYGVLRLSVDLISRS